MNLHFIGSSNLKFQRVGHFLSCDQKKGINCRIKKINKQKKFGQRSEIRYPIYGGRALKQGFADCLSFIESRR